MIKYMKNIYRFLSVVAMAGAAVALSSCDNEEFLATTQYDIVDANAMFESDDNAKMGMTGVYKMVNQSDQDGDWGFKPNLMVGCHPTMDTQATGWDKDWMVQNWNAGSNELAQGWAHCYHGIARCNDFLGGLEASKDRITPSLATTLEGEGRAVRAFFYMWLATSFGRVPLLSTGESYVTHPQKARAETYVEMWDFIIEDLEAASKNLDWQPLDGVYGHATKGMALAYLGDAYMWKAYRLTDGANGQTQDAAKAKECYQKAADAFKQIIDSHVYELQPSFTTNWDPAGVWSKECIWAEILDEGDNASKWETTVSRIMIKWYTASQANGGWGSEFLSWEWWSSFEPGDKRRAGSAVSGAVHKINPNDPAYDPQYAGWYEPAVFGYHPYLHEVLNQAETDGKTAYFHNNWGEPAPSIWTMKLWRTASANDAGGANSWGHDMWSTTPLYWKRLSNVMLDYAECLFILNGEGDATAWGLINELRNRAFGNLEVGKAEALTARYLPYYQALAQKNYGVDPATFTEYPIPFNTAAVIVPDAKTYYTNKTFRGTGTKPAVWKIAVNEERRKEFCSEWCLRPDLQRSNYLEANLALNYPKQDLTPEQLQNVPWSNRNYDFNPQKMDMPIPAGELSKNSLCDQNPGY